LVQREFELLRVIGSSSYRDSPFLVTAIWKREI